MSDLHLVQTSASSSFTQRNLLFRHVRQAALFELPDSVLLGGASLLLALFMPYLSPEPGLCTLVECNITWSLFYKEITKHPQTLSPQKHNMASSFRSHSCLHISTSAQLFSAVEHSRAGLIRVPTYFASGSIHSVPQRLDTALYIAKDRHLIASWILRCRSLLHLFEGSSKCHQVEELPKNQISRVSYRRITHFNDCHAMTHPALDAECKYASGAMLNK